MKAYRVKSCFLTLQGEGFWTGRRAVFVRFSGCNLWSGREEDRTTAACPWCDTDFVGGTRMSAIEIGTKAVELWGMERHGRFLVLTGGEPTLQADWPLLQLLQRYGFEVAIETNGTRQLPCRFDWVTCSPKAGQTLALGACDELKLVYPQDGLSPEEVVAMFPSGCGHRFLQPMDGLHLEANTQAAVRYCLEHPGWRLSLQTHKITGIP